MIGVSCVDGERFGWNVYPTYLSTAGSRYVWECGNESEVKVTCDCVPRVGRVACVYIGSVCAGAHHGTKSEEVRLISRREGQYM